MPKIKAWKGAASVAYRCKTNSNFHRPWHLRWKPVTASTEVDLSQWLADQPFSGIHPRAFLAGRQTCGKGQQGRNWYSPKGGIWLSAALPFEAEKQSAGLFGLAVALALSTRLKSSSVVAKIKWPNDLIVGNRKLAGFLPRLIYRGSTLRFVRVGLGLNVSNNVPLEGVALKELLGMKSCHLGKWTSEVLFSLEEAIGLCKNPKQVCYQAEKILWSDELRDLKTNDLWKIDSLNIDGSLNLRQGNKKRSLKRW